MEDLRPVGVALVTGAAGFIGERVCLALQREGWRLHAVDAFRDLPRNRAAAERLSRRGIRVEACDLSVARLDGWLRGCDLVIHLAGRPGVRDRDAAAMKRDNVVAVRRMLRALGSSTGTQLVFASSSSVTAAAGGNGHLTYAESKRQAEQLVQDASVPATTLRLFSVYGPGQRSGMAFAAACQALSMDRTLSIFGDGSHARDWTYIDDVVDAILASHSAPPSLYEVGAGKPTSLIHALGLLEQVAGRRLCLEFQPAHPLDAAQTCADPELSLPGWSARIPLEDGLRFQWRHHSQRLHTRPTTAAAGETALTPSPA
jgi:nucleoside-diphosphate-sugar epimerase